MTINLESQAFGYYAAACRDLEKLWSEFEDAAEGPEPYPPLFHQLIWFDTELTDAQIKVFQKDNTKPDGDWQKWDEFPDNVPCGRFYGKKDSFDVFVRMAIRGIEILERIARLRQVDEIALPGDLVLNLPDFGGHRTWVYLLYETARAYSTPMLHSQSGYWGCTGQVDHSEVEVWTTVSGVDIPAHPAWERLSCNLFQASAEAIDYWFNPENAETFEPCLGETAVFLPPEPEENGPEPPDRFWLRGTCYGGFTPKEWLLLECLWGRDCVSTEDVMRHIWGEDNEGEGALKSLYKRLNSVLREKKMPGNVRMQKEWLRLNFFKRPELNQHFETAINTFTS